MKIVIVGRSGSGKSRLAGILQANGLSLLRTCTTRPRRRPEEDGYVFLTTEEAAGIPAREKLVPTVIDGYEYFTTAGSVANSDVMILEPDGVAAVLASMPDTAFLVVNMIVGNEEKASDLAAARSDDPEREREVYARRRADEEPRFARFDHEFGEGSEPGPMFPESAFHRNCQASVRFVNDFEPGRLDGLAGRLVARWRAHANLEAILEQCADMGILRRDGDRVVLYGSSGGEQVSAPLSVDNVAEIMLSEADAYPSGLSSLMVEWLGHELTIGVPPELVPD